MASPTPAKVLSTVTGFTDSATIDSLANRIVSESRTHHLDPASLEGIQTVLRLDPSQVSSLARFHKEFPKAFVSLPSNRGTGVHCHCLDPETDFTATFLAVAGVIPCPPQCALSPAQIMQMCFGGLQSTPAHLLFGFPAPPMPPPNQGYLTYAQATSIGAFGFPQYESPASAFRNLPFSHGFRTIAFSHNPEALRVLRNPEFAFYPFAGLLYPCPGFD